MKPLYPKPPIYDDLCLYGLQQICKELGALVNGDLRKRQTFVDALYRHDSKYGLDQPIPEKYYPFVYFPAYLSRIQKES